MAHGQPGKQWLYRAYKDNDGKIGTYGEEVNDATPDIRTPPISVHPWSRPIGCFFINLGFQISRARIQAARIEYYFDRQNSNLFTYTLLSAEGFRMNEAQKRNFQKGHIFFGWGHNLFGRNIPPPPFG